MLQLKFDTTDWANKDNVGMRFGYGFELHVKRVTESRDSQARHKHRLFEFCTLYYSIHGAHLSEVIDGVTYNLWQEIHITSLSLRAI